MLQTKKLPNINLPKLTEEELTLQNIKLLRDMCINKGTQFSLDMSRFGAINVMDWEEITPFLNKEDNTVNMAKLPPCNTSCCLLGSAVSFLPVSKEMLTKNSFNYDLFGVTHFPSLYIEEGEKRTDAWHFLFGHLWPDEIPHALKRMDIILELGLGEYIDIYIDRLEQVYAQ